MLKGEGERGKGRQGGKCGEKGRRKRVSEKKITNIWRVKRRRKEERRRGEERGKEKFQGEKGKKTSNYAYWRCGED